MKSVLILGGYGGFGARLSRRLASDGWQVILAGRSLENAQSLASDLPGAKAVCADRGADIGAVLKREAPDLVVDAAGPFQNSDDRVILACISQGIDYCDLADARDFVSSVGKHDNAAKAAGIVVLSGASSVPALSSAVLDELTDGLERTDRVEIAISASNRAGAGRSVSEAILSYAGQPIDLWLGGRRVVRHGLGSIRRQTYAIPGAKPIRRLVALAEVPDLTIVPETRHGRPATIFRAGPEFGFQVIGLWLLSWLVRWRMLGSLAKWSPFLTIAQRITGGLGGARSAMQVAVTGQRGSAIVHREWNLIADHGDGPEIPVLAAQLFARQVASSRAKAGARSGAGQFSLSDFQPLFDELSIRHATIECEWQPLYARVLGPSFDEMPEQVRKMHIVGGDSGASGHASVERGHTLLARLVAAIMRFPPTGEYPLHVHFAEDRDGETWTRHFGKYSFASRLEDEDGVLTERFGPLRFYFDLPADRSGLQMIIRRWSFLRIPMPRWLSPRTQAIEWADGDWFCFEVPISLPIIGKIVRYRGKLRRIDAA